MPLSNLQRQHCNPVVGKHCLMEQQEADDAAEGKPWQHAGSTKLFLATTIPAASWKTQHCNQMAGSLLESAGEELEAVVGVDLAGNRA